MNDNQLVKAVQAYKIKRAQIKARQKTELEAELEAWKADVGENITRVRRESHASIEDVGAIIGISNRTFIYDMINAFKRREKLIDSVAPDGTVINDSTGYGSEDNKRPGGRDWDIEFYDGFAKLYIADETYEIPVLDGEPEFPEEWMTHSRERRLQYKDILSEIRKHVW